MSLISVRELDQAINDIFGPMYSISTEGEGQTLHVTHHTENEVRHEIFAAGATKEDVSIDVQDGVMTISVQPKIKSSFVKPLKRSFRMSKEDDLDSINAKLENGILNVSVQKLKTPKKSITVSVN